MNALFPLSIRPRKSFNRLNVLLTIMCFRFGCQEERCFPISVYKLNIKIQGILVPIWTSALNNKRYPAQLLACSSSLGFSLRIEITSTWQLLYKFKIFSSTISLRFFLNWNGESGVRPIVQSASRSVSQLVSQPVGQSASWSVSQLVSQPIVQSASHSASRPVDQSVGQSASWYVSQSVSQSVCQPVGQSTSRPVSQSASGHPMSWSVSQSVSQRVPEFVSQSVGQPVDQPVGLPADQSVSQSFRQPVGQPVSRLVSQSLS